MEVISEARFRSQLLSSLEQHSLDSIGSVTGPGRSGAIAAVYVSHILGVPFIPYKQNPPVELGNLLIVDTAIESGATLRKAVRFYEKQIPVTAFAVYEEPPRVSFWYEAEKPQKYRHERRIAQ